MMEENFKWVTARHACTVFEVFQRLLIGCTSDIEERNALRAPAYEYGFRIIEDSNGESFRVLRQGNKNCSSVEVRRTDAGISVRAEGGLVLLEASITLNDEGECRLKVNKEELTLWQFRKRALEDLLFKFQSN